MHTFWVHDPLTIWTFFNKIPFHNLNFFLPFNSGTNTTSHCRKHPNFIKNGLCPWHFYSLNLLKLEVYINHNLLMCFGRRGRFIINIDNNNFQHGIWIYVKDLRWKKMQFKVMMIFFCLLLLLNSITSQELKIRGVKFSLEFEHQRNI